MKIEPIKIDIKDNKKYGEIAFLVDRGDFLKEVARLRDKWQIKHLYKPNHWYDWIKELQKQNKSDIFWNEIKSIRKRFNLTSNFDLPILMAVVCGYVNGSFYRTASIAPLNGGADMGLPTMFAIYITPDTTKRDLDLVFKEFKSQVKLVRKIRPVDRFYLPYGNPKPDTIGNVKRDREWYWQHKQGKSYGQILKEALAKGEHITRDGIIKAIKQYENLLSVEI